MTSPAPSTRSWRGSTSRKRASAPLPTSRGAKPRVSPSCSPQPGRPAVLRDFSWPPATFDAASPERQDIMTDAYEYRAVHRSEGWMIEATDQHGDNFYMTCGPAPTEDEVRTRIRSL